MAMYFMSGKTFLNQYINEDPKKVMKTQFVIVSSTIRKNGKYEDQVINGNNVLAPSQYLIADYDDYKHNTEYRREYFNQLDEGRAFLATIIKYVIEENMTVVLLCGQREKKYNYLNMIQEYVEQEFGFHIYDYKKYKDGKEKPVKIDQSEVLYVCNRILKKAKKDKKKKMLSTEKGRKSYISEMKKKTMKKELKKRGLYVDDMSKSEMEDMLQTFL